MKTVVVLFVSLFLLPGVFAGTVTNSYGDPGDAYLEYTIAGPDFSIDTDGPPVHNGVYTGEPITLNGKMIVSRAETVSWVTMTASLGDEVVVWPKEGESNEVQNKVVELPFSFTYNPPKDFTAEGINGNVRLEVCGGTCGVYNINLYVSVDKELLGSVVKPAEPVAQKSPESTASNREKQDAMKVTYTKTSGKGRDTSAAAHSIYGQVLIFPGDDPDNEIVLEPNTIIKEGDHIRTYGDSGCTISFPDGSTFVLKARSEVVFDLPERRSKLSILAGTIWANVKKMVQDGELEVTMNQAVAGIKGTTFILEDDGTTSTLKVIEGKVEYTSLVDGSKQMVETGEQLSATASGLGELEDFDITAEKENWPEVDNFEGKSGSSVSIIVLLLLAVAAGIYFVKKKR